MGHKNESNQKANQTYNRNDLNRPKPTSLTNIYFFFVPDKLKFSSYGQK